MHISKVVSPPPVTELVPSWSVNDRVERVVAFRRGCAFAGARMLPAGHAYT